MGILRQTRFFTYLTPDHLLEIVLSEDPSAADYLRMDSADTQLEQPLEAARLQEAARILSVAADFIEKRANAKVPKNQDKLADIKERDDA